MVPSLTSELPPGRPEGPPQALSVDEEQAVKWANFDEPTRPSTADLPTTEHLLLLQQQTHNKDERSEQGQQQVASAVCCADQPTHSAAVMRFESDFGFFVRSESSPSTPENSRGDSCDCNNTTATTASSSSGSSSSCSSSSGGSGGSSGSSGSSSGSSDSSASSASSGSSGSSSASGGSSSGSSGSSGLVAAAIVGSAILPGNTKFPVSADPSGWAERKEERGKSRREEGGERRRRDKDEVRHRGGGEVKSKKGGGPVEAGGERKRGSSTTTGGTNNVTNNVTNNCTNSCTNNSSTATTTATTYASPEMVWGRGGGYYFDNGDPSVYGQQQQQWFGGGGGGLYDNSYMQNNCGGGGFGQMDAGGNYCMGGYYDGSGGAGNLYVQQQQLEAAQAMMVMQQQQQLQQQQMQYQQQMQMAACAANNSGMMMGGSVYGGGGETDKADWEVDPSELIVEEHIGAGATSEVFRGSWRGTDVAIKKLNIPQQLSMKAFKDFQRELSIVLLLRHPNLVLFMGASCRSKPFLVITEYCAGGTLFQLLHGNPDSFTEGGGGQNNYNYNSNSKKEGGGQIASVRSWLTWRQKVKLATDIAKGLTYLHGGQPQIIHRDLKSLNILLVDKITTPSDVPQAKVTDFGLSRVCRPSSYNHYNASPHTATTTTTTATSAVGTYHWMAPEVFEGRPYNEKVDVYSYAIVLYEILTCTVPYQDLSHSPVHIGMSVVNGNRPDIGCLPPDCPKPLRRLMEACWDPRAEHRPSFRSILAVLKELTNMIG
eukprot:GHVS01033141.1.p1 GENE.GHVS01033141.1~~GHVS01033141.1.p1  ORF type:complete len:769 (-),score=275.73 GHVS01033141.1:115-2421(-)